MKFLATVAAFAAVAAAQSATSTAGSSSSSGSSCEAQNILDACKATIQGQINSCQSNDWSCLCENYGNMLTCYNNCPNDVGVTTVQQQRDQNCIAASAYGSSTSTHATGSATATAATSTTSDSEESAQSGFASATGSAGASAATNSDSSAASMQIGANLVFAAGAAAYMFM